MRQGDGGVVEAEFVQLLAQVVVTVDLDAAEPDDLLEKLDGELLGPLILLGDEIGERLAVAEGGVDVVGCTCTRYDPTRSLKSIRAFMNASGWS